MEILLVAGLLAGNALLFGAAALFNNRNSIKNKLTESMKSLTDNFKENAMVFSRHEADNYALEHRQQEEAEREELLAPLDRAIEGMKQDNILKELEIAKKKEILSLEKQKKELDEQSRKISEAMSEFSASLEELPTEVEPEESSCVTKGYEVYDPLKTRYMPVNYQTVRAAEVTGGIGGSTGFIQGGSIEEREAAADYLWDMKYGKTGEKLKLLSEQSERAEDSLSNEGIVLSVSDIEGLERTVYGRYAYFIIAKTFKLQDLYMSNFVDAVRRHLLMEPKEVDNHINLLATREKLVEESGHKSGILRENLDTEQTKLTPENKLTKLMVGELDPLSLGYAHTLSDTEINQVCKFHIGTSATVSLIILAITMRNLKYSEVVSCDIKQAITHIAEATQQKEETVRAHIKVPTLRAILRRKQNGSHPYTTFGKLVQQFESEEE